jgi:integrase
LRWSDVDAQSREIRVRQQVIVANNRTIITPLKTRASIRTLPLLAFVSEALDRRRERQEQERLVASTAWQESGLVFTSTVGTMYQPANLHKRWQGHLRNADLPIVPFHSLRHTAASFLVALNVHPRVAMEILGHSNIKPQWRCTPMPSRPACVTHSNQWSGCSGGLKMAIRKLWDVICGCQRKKAASTVRVETAEKPLIL